MHKPTSPTSFLRSPGGAGPLPQAQPARVVAVERAPVVKQAAPKQSHQTEARLSVRLPDRVELNREALRQLTITYGRPIELIPPRRGGSRQWLLDTRPTAPGRLVAYNGLGSFRTAFRLDVRYLPTRPGKGRASKLEFTLGPELTERVCVTMPATEYSPARQQCETRGTGVYELLPRRYGTEG